MKLQKVGITKYEGRQWTCGYTKIDDITKKIMALKELGSKINSLNNT